MSSRAPRVTDTARRALGTYVQREYRNPRPLNYSQLPLSSLNRSISLNRPRFPVASPVSLNQSRAPISQRRPRSPMSSFNQPRAPISQRYTNTIYNPYLQHH